MVTAPGDNGECCEIHQKFDLEWACLAEAGRRFTQSHTTPLLSAPLLQIFGEKGLNDEVDEVLTGKFQAPPQSDFHAAQFLQSLA